MLWEFRRISSPVREIETRRCWQRRAAESDIKDVSDMKSSPMSDKKGHLYLVWEREFVKSSETIYKIGMTENIMKRMSQYPKGSNMLFCILTSNVAFAEKSLIQAFCVNYKARPDIGREYFEGNADDMINTMITFVLSNRESLPIEPDSCVPKKRDDSMVIMEYVDMHRDQLSKQTLKSKEIYNSFIQWIEKNGYTNYLSHTKMTRELVKAYGVSTKVHRFTSGTDQALVFPNLMPIPEQAPPSDLFIDYLRHMHAINKEKDMISFLFHEFLSDYHRYLKETAHVSDEVIRKENTTKIGLRLRDILNEHTFLTKEKTQYAMKYVFDNRVLGNYLSYLVDRYLRHGF
jgi:hypothetical protein